MAPSQLRGGKNTGSSERVLSLESPSLQDLGLASQATNAGAMQEGGHATSCGKADEGADRGNQLQRSHAMDEQDFEILK
eukprot:9103812-Karenia_brevis.AAC.1